MNKIFYGYNSLIHLPDLSKWNIFNINEMDDIFDECFSLLFIPGIHKLDISKKIKSNYQLNAKY